MQMNLRFFEMAKNMAEMSDFARCKIGCVVVYKNKVLSASFNTNKTHPLQKRYNKLRFDADTPHKLHAEIHALSFIKDLDIDWSKVAIYTYRITKTGFGKAKPCPSCTALIRELGIKNIFFTDDDGYNHLILSKYESKEAA